MQTRHFWLAEHNGLGIELFTYPGPDRVKIR